MNFNEKVEPGIYSFSNGAYNTPAGIGASAFGILYVIRVVNQPYILQELLIQGVRYYRTSWNRGTNWNSWYKYSTTEVATENIQS